MRDRLLSTTVIRELVVEHPASSLASLEGNWQPRGVDGRHAGRRSRAAGGSRSEPTPPRPNQNAARRMCSSRPSRCRATPGAEAERRAGTATGDVPRRLGGNGGLAHGLTDTAPTVATFATVAVAYWPGCGTAAHSDAPAPPAW